jgi:demethylmenaquinone methyltransferase / 2-methoxy-6-polyprenyl-1,4-benzoquinol methylase
MSLAVQALFERIAPGYDVVNRVASLGVDRAWRRRAVAALGDVRGARVLDVCAGTLDLSALLVRAGAHVTACDFAPAMLARGAHKAPGAARLTADACALPLADRSFDAVVCGFGLRNLDNYSRGLDEWRRVLSPTGTLVILEFFRPRRAVTRAFQVLYNRQLLPLLGGALTGDRGAYRYLVDSIERFATRAEVEAEVARRFARVRGQDLTLGVASLVVASC